MSQTFQKIMTDRLIIRPLTIFDATIYHEAELASAKDMAPYWSWVNPNKPLTDIEAFLREAESCHQKNTPPAMYFAVIAREDQAFLGCIWYAATNWFVPRFEIGYWQDSRRSGQGYMTEAVNALTRGSFILYDAKRVEVKVFVTNQKSRAIPERLGFKSEAILENYFIEFVTHEILDGAIYACTHINDLPPLKMEIIK